MFRFCFHFFSLFLTETCHSGTETCLLHQVHIGLKYAPVSLVKRHAKRRLVKECVVKECVVKLTCCTAYLQDLSIVFRATGTCVADSLPKSLPLPPPLSPPLALDLFCPRTSAQWAWARAAAWWEASWLCSS